jgi:hypothetical protein
MVVSHLRPDRQQGGDVLVEGRVNCEDGCRGRGLRHIQVAIAAGTSQIVARRAPGRAAQGRARALTPGLSAAPQAPHLILIHGQIRQS